MASPDDLVPPGTPGSDPAHPPPSPGSALERTAERGTERASGAARRATGAAAAAVASAAASAHRAVDRAERAIHRAEERLHAAQERIEGAIERAMDEVEQAVHEVEDQINSAEERVHDAVRDANERIDRGQERFNDELHRAMEAEERVMEAAGRVAHFLGPRAERAVRRIDERIDRVEERIERAVGRVNEQIDRAQAQVNQVMDEVHERIHAAEDLVNGAMREVRERVHAAEDVLHAREAAIERRIDGAIADAHEAIDAVAGAAEAVIGAVGEAIPIGSAAIRGALRDVVGAASDAVDAGATSMLRGVERTVELAEDAVDAARELLSGHGERPLPEVEFHFETSADTGAEWRVREVRLREGISEIYECAIDLCTEDLGAEPDAMLGRTCVFTMTRESLTRRLCGIVRRVEDSGTTAGKRLVRVLVVPQLWLLSQRRDIRIFQDMTAVDVVRRVLDDAGLYQDSLSDELQRQYPRREYCVQYRESDLDFVMRLLQEEGIAFHFQHVDETETLVLVDEVNAYPSLTTMDGGAVPVMGPEMGTARIETVRRFDWFHEMRPTGVVLRDFDFTHPTAEREMTRTQPRTGAGERAVYDYPARFTIGNYDTDNFAYTRNNGARLAEVRFEELQTRARVGGGTGVVTGMTPGLTFELQGHGRADLDGRYLITRVEHYGYAPEETTNDTEGGRGRERDRYWNTFECVPADAPFRPARVTPRPLVRGAQTATVVGPAGEEIYVDHHGRIKVQFHWDRQGRRDENSSCWVRVAQNWAGAGWGFVFVPRIGMEVIVDFLEGDPDRPIVTGCVYNGEHATPYELPREKTKSTIKTSSSPGGGGYNELRFEDASGSEEIFVHAQKDYNEVVEHDHSTLVHHDQSNTVDVNQTERIGVNQTLSVGGNRSKTVKGNETTTVQKNRTETVHQDETITVHGNRTETVHQDETITVHGSRTEQVTGLETLVLDSSRQTTVAQNDALSVGQNYVVSAAAKYELTQGPSRLTLTSGHVELAAGGYITLTHASGTIDVEESGKIKVSSGSEIELTCGGCTVKISNGKVSITAPAAIELGVGASTIKIDPTGVTTSAPKITSSASGVQEITGLMVKIN